MRRPTWTTRSTRTSTTRHGDRSILLPSWRSSACTAKSRRAAACQPGRAARAAGADPAAHRGSHGTDPRRTSAAVGGQLVDVLGLLDTQSPVEQVIAVPKIPQDPIPHCAAFEPQLAEQLVEVPTAVTHVPGSALFHDRHGHEWVWVLGPTGVYFWKVSTNPSRRDTPPVQGGI